MADATLKDTAEQALIGLIQSAADAMTFLKGEIPIAVRELLTYYTALYSVGIVAALLLMVMAWLWIRHWKPIQQKKIDADVNVKGYSMHDHFITVAPAAVATCIALFLAILSGIPLLKITLAPRIWLIEYAASLVK